MTGAPVRAIDGLYNLDRSVYARIVTDMADSVIGIDQHHIIRLCNPAAEALFGWSRDEIIGKPVNMLIPERFHNAHDGNVESFRGETADARYMGNRKGFILGQTRAGHEISLGATILNVIDSREPLMVAILRDLTERLEHQSELQRLANTDPLSGALNRRAFRDVAETEIHNSRLRNHPTALILFDIDHFKGVNDQHGHHTGDRVICEFTDLLRTSLRAHDILGRWGGEEFIVLLPSASLDQAISVSERIRRAVENAAFSLGSDIDLRLTASAGVTHARESETLDGFIRRADLALYAAKENGRNRVFVFGVDHEEAIPFEHDEDRTP